MNTQTEKIQFNKLALISPLLLIISMVIWFSIIEAGTVGNVNMIAHFIEDTSDTPIALLVMIIMLFPVVSLFLSIGALVQIGRRKERGKLLSILTIVVTILFLGVIIMLMIALANKGGGQ